MAARLPYLSQADLPEADRNIYDQFRKTRGSEPGHIHRVVANAPNLLRQWLAMADELRNHTRLDPTLRELAICTVGRLTGAEYEFVHHWNLALGVGVRRDQLEALADFERSPAFNEQERAVIRYAVEATSNVKVGDATFSALRGFLDDRRIMELAMNVAFYNLVVRIIVPMGVELEPGTTKN
jgi:alkylhydroperoxidase family enzyme